MSNTFRDTTNLLYKDPVKGSRDKTAKPHSSDIKKQSSKRKRSDQKNILNHALETGAELNL